jgi:lysophospholipase L1-like esterase
MIKSLIQISLVFLLMNTPISRTTIWLCGDSTIAIKETKTYPETGWGMPFVYFWDSSVVVKNLAKNGRSTKTFISEKLWQQVIDGVKEGDYVFIQFGHNDESKEKKERYATEDTFKMNLTRFINETKAKKAIPVLFTPVSRRKFNDEGVALETHLEYSNYVKQVAESEKVLFVDLDAKSRGLYQQFGKEFSKQLFLQLKPGEHPNYPDGKEDNTHFNELGARLIAQLVLQEIRNLNTSLNQRIIVPVKK